MLLALKKSGKFKSLAGLIIGGMTNIKDTEVPFGKTVEETILEKVSHLNIPICFNFTAGHIKDNRALIFGKEAHLQVNSNKVIFIQNK